MGCWCGWLNGFVPPHSRGKRGFWGWIGHNVGQHDGRGLAVAALDGYQPSEDVNGLEEQFRGRFLVGEEGVEFDAEEGNFLVQAADVQGVVEILKLFGGKVLGVEAVLAGVLVAGLAAALTLAGDIVEGTLGRGVRAGEGFEEGFDFIHGGRVAGGWGFGQWVDVRGDFGSWWRGIGRWGNGHSQGVAVRLGRGGGGVRVSEARWAFARG